MPLTKLARRYHLQKRPQGESENENTPMKNVKMALDFENPEPPPYVTVRKKKPSSRPLECLHGTVLESRDYGISDCKNWKRAESTHIDHIAESLGHLTLMTEDISIIHPRVRRSQETEASFKTASSKIPSFEDTKDVSCQVNVNENSNRDISSDSDIYENEEVANPPSMSTTRLSKVASWVMNSPFQSPDLHRRTIVISESDDDSIIDVSEATSKGHGVIVNVKESVIIDSEHESSNSSLPVQEHLSKTPVSIPKKNDENIARLWQLSLSNVQEESKIPKDSSKLSTPTVPSREQSRSVSLQVSLNSSGNTSSVTESSVESKASPSHRSSKELQVSLNSSGNTSIVESSCTPSRKSVNLQVSLTEDESVEENCDNDNGDHDIHASFTDGSNVIEREINEENNRISNIIDGLSDNSSSEPSPAVKPKVIQKNNYGNRLNISSSSDDDSSVLVEDFRVNKSRSRSRTPSSEISGIENSPKSSSNLFLEDSSQNSLSSSTLSFLNSLSLESPSEMCHPDAVKYVKNFNKHKDELITKLFRLYNEKAFESALPNDMYIIWNPRLTKTAGVCVQRKIRINNAEEQRISKIELSSKVVDSADRLRDTCKYAFSFTKLISRMI